MNNDIILIITISLILILSPFFAKITKLPITPLEIILGSIVSYMGLIHQSHLYELLAEIGFLYLMFLAGLEVDLKKLFKTDINLIKKGLIYISILYFISFITALILDMGKILIVTLPLISIGLLASIIKEHGKDHIWIKYALTIGVLGEVISIVVLTIVSASASFGIGYLFYKTLFILVMFFIISLGIFKILRLLFWWYPEIKTYLMPYSNRQEQDIRMSFAIFFITIAMTLYLHLEVAFGAFIAGIFIASFFEHKKELPEKLESFGFGFLIPIFFIHIGTSFKIEALFMEGLLINALIITLIMIFMRIGSSFTFYKELGFRDTIHFALAHSMPLTLLIAVVTLAHQSNSIDDYHYYSFILASIFEVIFVMLLIKISLKFSHTNHNVNK